MSAHGTGIAKNMILKNSQKTSLNIFLSLPALAETKEKQEIVMTAIIYNATLRHLQESILILIASPNVPVLEI